jgi:hypothetical protein
MSEEQYTESELKEMSRVLLRQTAVRVLQIANKDAASLRSEDIVKQILEAQGGKKGGKKAGAKATTKAKEEAPEEAPEETQEEAPKGRGRAAGGNGVGVSEAVDAVGKTLDEVLSKLDMILANQGELERKSYITMGLVTDLYKFQGEPDELEARIEELSKEWEETSTGNE